MNRDELERLTKPELIDLLLRMRRADKASRTPSKPPGLESETGGSGQAVPSPTIRGCVLPKRPMPTTTIAQSIVAIADYHFPKMRPAQGSGEDDEIDLFEVKPIVGAGGMPLRTVRHDRPRVRASGGTGRAIRRAHSCPGALSQDDPSSITASSACCARARRGALCRSAMDCAPPFTTARRGAASGTGCLSGWQVPARFLTNSRSMPPTSRCIALPAVEKGGNDGSDRPLAWRPHDQNPRAG